MNRISILDIPFDKVTHKEALEKTLSALQNSRQKAFFIATPNPEMLLEAKKNPEFKKILQQTDLNIADGSGIILASKWQKTPLPERITGVDFMQEICKAVTEKHAKKHKIFLLGAAPGVAEKVKQILELRFSGLVVAGFYSGSAATGEEQKICSHINKCGADILFVAFGAPKQELWLARNLPHLKNIKLAMGIGGAFDFIAGVRKRAPKWMQKLGLEWLYRLIQEPSRIKRIYNAVIKFPLVFLLKNNHKNKSQQL